MLVHQNWSWFRFTAQCSNGSLLCIIYILSTGRAHRSHPTWSQAYRLWIDPAVEADEVGLLLTSFAECPSTSCTTVPECLLDSTSNFSGGRLCSSSGPRTPCGKFRFPKDSELWRCRGSRDCPTSRIYGVVLGSLTAREV